MRLLVLQFKLDNKLKLKTMKHIVRKISPNYK